MVEVFTTYNLMLTVLGVGLVISIFGIRNLLKKVERYEDYITQTDEYVDNVRTEISEGSKHLNDLDNRGLFQADDELGSFFNSMKEVQKNLDKYLLASDDAEKKS